MWSQSSKDKKIVCQKQIGKKEFRGYHEEQGSKHQSQMNGKIQRHSCKVGDVQWEMGRTSSMKRSKWTYTNTMWDPKTGSSNLRRPQARWSDVFKTTS
jgi:hypothetical protein